MPERSRSHAPGAAYNGGEIRPALRVPLIDAVLEGGRGSNGRFSARAAPLRAQRDRGAKAALSLKDVGGFGAEQIVSTQGWAAALRPLRR